MPMYTIAIDTGNKQIKTENFMFISGLFECGTVPPGAGPDEYFRYRGKYYAESMRRAEYLRDKSETDRYFLLTLFGIVKELDRMDGERSLYRKDKTYHISLLVGLPPAHMQNQALKKNYVSYFRMKDPEPVKYKGRTWHIRISRVSVFPQCYAALTTIEDKIENCPRVLAVDIGGFTADYMMLESSRIDFERTGSLENGVIMLYRRILSECEAQFDAVIEETDVDSILAKDPAPYIDKKIVLAVNDISQRFVNRLLAGFREIDIDLRHCQTVFMGGGSVLLKQFIENSTLITSPLFVTDIHANAKGYRMIYDAQHEGEGDAL